MVRDELLATLKAECERRPISNPSILRALEALLVWLNEPANNTDENCRAVDLFACTEIRKPAHLSEELDTLLYDLGGQLHDAHSAPAVAENFQSTPQLLLARVRDLMRRTRVN